MTRVAFAAALGLDSLRVSNYEHGRVPLKFGFVDLVGKTFDLNQIWLAEGKESLTPYLLIRGINLGNHSKNSLFSQVYDEVLKPALASSRIEFLSSLDDFRLESNPMDIRDVRQGFFLHVIQSIENCPLPLRRDLLRSMAFALAKYEAVHWEEISQWMAGWETDDRDPMKHDLEKLKQMLTAERVYDISTSMRPPKTFKELLERTRKIVASPGMKAALARELNVPHSRVSEWISGKHQPSGEVTLALSNWVMDREEEKPKTPGRVTSTAKGKIDPQNEQS